MFCQERYYEEKKRVYLVKILKQKKERNQECQNVVKKGKIRSMEKKQDFF